MYLDDVYLRKENELFVFDRREIRLYRIERGQRIEEADPDTVAKIVTGPAQVVSSEHVRHCWQAP